MDDAAWHFVCVIGVLGCFAYLVCTLLPKGFGMPKDDEPPED